MNPKVTWTVVGLVAAVALGYLASRVGNIGARGVRDGHVPLELAFSQPVVPGVDVKVTWPTALGATRGPVIVKARSQSEEVAVGKGEFGAGQATIVMPCELGGQQVGVALYEVEDEVESLLAQKLANVLPAGPDCVQ